MRALIGLVMVLLFITSAAALPLTVDKVEVDDVELTTSGTNRFDVQRDGTVDVEVLLTATQDVDDVELEVFMSGFEYNDVSPLNSKTLTFDLDANNTRKFTLPIKISEDVEEDDYKLRLLISDRDGTPILQEYRLKIDVPRHELKIEDIILTPSGEVVAGQALLATVRVENQGEKDEDDVRVNVNVPGLGLSGSDYIDEVEADDEEETEEIFMRLPLCAKAGVYDVDVEVKYDENHRTARKSAKVKVRENAQCEENKAAPAQEVVVVQQQPPAQVQEEPAEEKSSKSRVRAALETLVIILVGLLVIVGLVIAFNKLKNEEDDEEY